MSKKEANALMRDRYGNNWFDRPGAKTERNALMAGKAAGKPKRVVPAPPKPPRKRVEAPPPPPRKRVRAPVSVPARKRVASGPPKSVMLAKVWAGQDPTGWWMSEKLDGMRAYWTGSGLYTRNGNPIAAPTWFLDVLPQGIALDGEIYMGRGRFQDVMSVARKATPRDPRWKQVKYMAFDAPEVPGGCEARFGVLERIVADACLNWTRGGACPLVFVEQTKCMSKAQLKRFHADIAALRGEGAMIRAPGSPYRATRTSELLKVVKKVRDEAKVIGYEDGKGKHRGRLGAYWLQWPKKSSPKFKVGTGMSDWDREHPLPKGTLVTIEFKGLTREGKPREPSFIGARDYE